MIPKECNIIGKGGHWIVERILVNDNGQKISVVRKHGKPGKADDNIATFNLVSKAGLPTLNRYVKVNDMEIEAEDLCALRRGTKEVRMLAENYRPPLNGERYMTDKEVAGRLKVSRRTLQEYRNDRKIPFILFGGKVL